MLPSPRLLILLALSLFVPSPASAGEKKLNVLFIAVDDLRPELGCYGNKIVKSPNIDKLASHGIVFGHAYCQQAVCSPSRSSLMTGRRPDATKVWDLETHFRVALPDAVTIPQHFKANGYYCSALSKIFHAGFEDGRSWSEPHWYPNGQTVDTDPENPLKRIVKKTDEGVKEYHKIPLAEDNDNPNAGKGKKAPKGDAFEMSNKPEEELPDGATATEAVRRLHALKEKGEPFFFAVGFLKPHLPFVAPKKYWDLYNPNDIPKPAIDHLPEGAPVFAGHDNGELHSYANVPKGNPVPEDFAKTLRHGYYACVSYLDAQVGKVLEALDKEGLADNTVIVLWGDHGWQLGDHGLWHKHTNFELATRAPLLMIVPHAKHAGETCAVPVEFVDIYPTLAEVCGLPAPSGVDGKSLKPLLEDPAAPVTRYAVSQYPRGGAQTGNRPLMGYSVRDAQWRLTVWKDRKNNETVATELYDEKYDSAESVNVASKPENKEIVATLLKHLPEQAAAVKAAAAVPTKAAPASADAGKKKEPQDRAKLFENKDTNHDGKLTHEEFMKGQKDPEEAAKRFEKMDADKDGFLSKEEFVRGMGKAK